MVGGGGIRTIVLRTYALAQHAEFEIALVAPGLFKGWSDLAVEEYAEVYKFCININSGMFKGNPLV